MVVAESSPSVSGTWVGWPASPPVCTETISRVTTEIIYEDPSSFPRLDRTFDLVEKYDFSVRRRGLLYSHLCSIHKYCETVVYVHLPSKITSSLRHSLNCISCYVASRFALFAGE